MNKLKASGWALLSAGAPIAIAWWYGYDITDDVSVTFQGAVSTAVVTAIAYYRDSRSNKDKLL